jgi:hypothetical protein
MHSLRNLLPRHTDRESRLWPKSPGSPKSPKSPKPPKSPQYSSFSKIRENYDHTKQCVGCDGIDILLRHNIAQLKDDLERRPSVILHNSFAELDQCSHDCDICRVFRQSLFLEQITFDDVEALRATQGEVVVCWQETPTIQGAPGLYLNVNLRDSSIRAGVIDLNSKDSVGPLALRSNGLDTAVIKQARGWLNTCRTSHTGKCDNLRWGGENPRLLIEILSDTTIRLREKEEGDYVALSYCWGQSLSDHEYDIITRGRTVKSNLDRRRYQFFTSDLPTAVRDALQIIRAMGIQYAWIDALCIVQDDLVDGKPKGVETMHQVYSNALFTLCACATTGATRKLLGQREAWIRKTEPCRLGGRWLTTLDMSLNELRLRSPLAGRAWTLQEERLSPRMLYVSSNRMYWSCAKGQEMEMKPTYPQSNNRAPQRPVYAPSDHNADMPQSQEFLVACYNGQTDLHSFWADIVKSYAFRHMGDLGDRLTALSGLAAKYLSTSSLDEYLAGLWANNLAEGLAWRVCHAVDDGFRETYAKDGSPFWPSWSWAVLPRETEIETVTNSAKPPYFRRVLFGDAYQGIGIEDRIRWGQDVKMICVQGRIRDLWKPLSHWSDWSTISRLVGDEERFVFAVNPEQNTHALETSSGRVLVYEDRKREVISQLDFKADVTRIKSSQVHLYAFELGSSTMLLLEHCGQGIWRRVGVAWDVREDYFAKARCETLYLQ